MQPDPPFEDLPEPTLLPGLPGVLALLGRFALFEGLEPAALEELARELEWLSLPGGAELFRQGDAPDCAYLLLHGALGAYERSGGALLARIHAGEAVGELGLFSGRPRLATVVALRDSDLARIPAAAFERVLLRHPASILRLARMAVERLDRSQQGRVPQSAPRSLALVPARVGIDVAGLAVELVDALSSIGRTELVWSVRGGSHGSQWFHNLESRNDFIVYAGEPGASAWTRLCVRQADIVLLLADAGSSPTPWPALDGAAVPHQRCELVLVHDGGIGRGAAACWSRLAPAAPVHHVAGGADLGRLARLLTGRSTGVVLSGGGARGFAHIGVVRALREAGVAIDAVGGTSMGAIVAAGVALGWDNAELVERMRRSFVDTNPLSDFTLPRVSLVAGRKVARLLEREFGGVDIEDLPLPYFCLSSNLTTGRPELHRSGPLSRWLRASIAIPGVLPPVCHRGEVLVDGGAMNNLPVSEMRRLGPGTVLGVDVGADDLFSSAPEAGDLPPLWRLPAWLRCARQQPGILRTLWRAAMISSATATAEQRAGADLLVRPPLESVELLDWKGFDRAVEAGYRHMAALLERDPGLASRSTTRATASAAANGATRSSTSPSESGAR